MTDGYARDQGNGPFPVVVGDLHSSRARRWKRPTRKEGETARLVHDEEDEGPAEVHLERGGGGLLYEKE